MSVTFNPLHYFGFCCPAHPDSRRCYALSNLTHLQQVVELEGYVIILVEGRDGKIKLYGSPADRDGLEVADEILDVNERKLDDVPRAMVIKHIHEVIIKQTRRI